MKKILYLTRAELESRQLADGVMMIRPAVDFEYEVSFYFINDKFEYALYAPVIDKRFNI